LRARFVARDGQAAMNDRSAHHMIPVDVVKDRDIALALKKAAKADWDFSDPSGNGAIVKQYTGPIQLIMLQ
jgi:hypothetical protein